MMTLAERLSAARATLTAAGISTNEAASDAELLARHALGWDRARLVTALRDPVPGSLDPAYERFIQRRAAREPASQIIGVREFWGLDFEVGPDVLTPRPETELIVQAALELSKTLPSDRPRIVDVGTGSGCIAIALATELPQARFVASDASPAALTIARRNADRHHVGDRIAFRHTDVVPPENGVEMIVSNPPYIPAGARPSLPPEVRDHEPGVALFGGDDGLDFYRQLLDRPRALVNGGWLIVEVGYGQADTVRELVSRRRARADGYDDWEPGKTYVDLQGIERVLTFRAVHRETVAEDEKP
jgi:release factor glutamine methyltransferase